MFSRPVPAYTAPRMSTVSPGTGIAEVLQQHQPRDGQVAVSVERGLESV